MTEKRRASNQHLRPWECLPQAVLNLLDLNGMYAYWDQSDNGLPGWRITRNSVRIHGSGIGNFVREGAPLDEWITAVEVARTW